VIVQTSAGTSAATDVVDWYYCCPRQSRTV